MNRRMSRRGKIRLWSYTLTALVILTGFAISGFGTAMKYRTQLEYGYERSLNQLSEHLNNIEITLTKGTYSGTAAGAADFAMNLWSEAGAAKTCLSALPTYGSELDGTYKFLSQVGEYSLSLAKKMSLSGTITNDERENLAKLSKHAKTLSLQVSDLCTQMNEGGMWSDRVEKVVKGYEEEGEDLLQSGMTEMEQGFTDYPTLLYDGPFSDHIERAEPLYLKDKVEVNVNSAKKVASKVTGLDDAVFEKGEDTKGKIPCYNFVGNGITVSVTKIGGDCSYMLNTREIDQNNITLSYDQCIKNAKDYIERMDMGAFDESYYSVNEGVCVINFAYLENNVTCYTDLVKVGVAMDNGEIVSFNAQGYIMNHHKRQVTTPAYTEEDAKKVLSPLLNVVNSKLAIIPLDTMEERICYEFYCTADDNNEILVYVNANTLQEEDIKILIKGDGGTLAI